MWSIMTSPLGPKKRGFEKEGSRSLTAKELCKITELRNVQTKLQKKVATAIIKKEPD